MKHLVALAMLAVISACTVSKKESPNTLHWPMRGGVKGLDPTQADDHYSHIAVVQGYEGLLQYHYLKRPFQLVPNLAESMPELSADKLTYTFKLKKGVLFHDDPCFKATGGKGREMVADDVVYSFKRVADPKVASPGFWVFDDRIVGINAWRDAAAKVGTTDYNLPIEGLKVIDRYTLQIKLTKPSYIFLYVFAMSFTVVMPHEALDHYGKDIVNHMVGTGPYKLDSFSNKTKLVFSRNPNYREEFYPSEGAEGDKEKGLLADAGKRIPFIDHLELTAFEEDQPRWLNYMQGHLDWLEVPKDNVAQVLTENKELRPEFVARGDTYHSIPLLDVTHDSFNMDDPIVGKNKYLRQAFSMVKEPEAWIKLYYTGQAITAQGPIPPGLSGYDSNLVNPYKQYNLEKAKELLAKAGYPGGKGLPPIQYVTVANSTNRQMNEYLEKALNSIGVKMEIKAYSWPEFTEAIKNKKGQLWGWAWNADYPDAENFLQQFYGKNVSPGPNDANYRNPEYDRLYEKALTLPDAPERTAIYKKMVAILVEDTPWIFGVHRISTNLTPKWLKNYKRHIPSENFEKYLRIDTELKK